MSHSVQMPALGESVTEGTVTRWLKQEGDTVAEDEPLLEVSTDKVDTEVPAPYAGVLEKILVAEDETVDVGAELAIIGDGSGAGANDAGSNDASTAAPQQSPAASEPAPIQSIDAPSSDATGSAPDTGEASGTEVTMPAMGESVTEGTITRWLKAVGDPVAVDEPLVEIATDKVDAEVPSPVAGTVVKLLAAEDDTVDVGAPIAIVGSGTASPAGDSAPSAPAAAAEPEPAPQPAVPQQPATPPPAAAPVAQPSTPQPTQQPPAVQEPAASQPAPSAPPASPTPATPPAAPAAAGAPNVGASRPAYVTPVVRKLAADHQVDLATVTGTGVGGRIRREDVLEAARRQQEAAARAAESAVAPVAAAPARPGPLQPDARAAALVGTTQPAPRIRQAIAQTMHHAVTSSAQVTTVAEVDATRIVVLRDRAKAVFETRGVPRLTVLPFFVKAVVEAAKALPIVNASLADDLSEITYHSAVNVGVEVDTDRGSIVPVIHGADDLSVSGLAKRIADLADRTRSGSIAPNELSGATITVANAGSVGALYETAIVVPPQAATLVVGSVVKRPVVVTDGDGDDVIAVRSIATIALSYDHRLIDGADAARYLAAVKRRIEGGDFESDLGL